MAAMERRLSVTMMTNEYPPNVYGGAGVHVDYLSRALAKTVDVEVRCFGDERTGPEDMTVRAYEPWELVARDGDPRCAKALLPLSTNLAMVKDPIKSDVVHCHTWYTFMAGFYAKELYGKPLVTTIHSLEPLRPWKEEQLGPAYRLSRWMERTGVLASDRVIAVSEGMKKDILKCYTIPEDRIRVIHNGIDLDEYKPVRTNDARREYGVGDKYVLFVGRMSRQKGIIHLLDAVPYLPEDVQIVLCAGAPDTEEIEREVVERTAGRPNVVLIREMVPKRKIIELYTNAAVFCCPSIYEPFGIINLEAMACETPVVASAVGGIPEVVVDGETGFLVEPGDPQALARAINTLLRDGELARSFGAAGRKHVEARFSWDAVALKTKDLYAELVEPSHS
ncbi:MAG: glycogen synthase [Firmicutes bacterium]|nr:glycogen synthase [Bacillota bacterium]MDH7494511.1 glycogen synthase [Bacillota bacterium]